MEPQQVQPNNSQPPLFNQPYQSPVPPAPTPPPGQFNQINDSPRPKSKLPLVLAVVSAVELLLIIILVVVAASNDKTAVAPKTDSAGTSKLQAPQAATSTGIQLNDDAISQSLSTLNDDQDFPTTKLDDPHLGL